MNIFFESIENMFNPSHMSFNLPGPSAANPSWLGEGKLVLITMTMAEVDTFDLETETYVQSIHEHIFWFFFYLETETYVQWKWRKLILLIWKRKLMFNPFMNIFFDFFFIWKRKLMFNPFMNIFFESIENMFNPSHMSFNLPGPSAANPSWLGEGKLVLITMTMAEVDTFDLESDLLEVFGVFSSKSRNCLAKCWREKLSGRRKCMLK